LNVSRDITLLHPGGEPYEKTSFPPSAHTSEQQPDSTCVPTIPDNQTQLQCTHLAEGKSEPDLELLQCSTDHSWAGKRSRPGERSPHESRRSLSEGQAARTYVGKPHAPMPQTIHERRMQLHPPRHSSGFGCLSHSISDAPPSRRADAGSTQPGVLAAAEQATTVHSALGVTVPLRAEAGATRSAMAGTAPRNVAQEGTAPSGGEVQERLSPCEPQAIHFAAQQRQQPLAGSPKQACHFGATAFSEEMRSRVAAEAPVLDSKSPFVNTADTKSDSMPQHTLRSSFGSSRSAFRLVLPEQAGLQQRLVCACMLLVLTWCMCASKSETKSGMVTLQQNLSCIVDFLCVHLRCQVHVHMYGLEPEVSGVDIIVCESTVYGLKQVLIHLHACKLCVEPMYCLCGHADRQSETLEYHPTAPK
jgi:hypothetical protein